MKFSSRFMKFIGGRDLVFGLIILILIGITIFVYHKVSFIFNPIITIFFYSFTTNYLSIYCLLSVKSNR